MELKHLLVVVLQLKTHIINYAKTRDTFAEYRKSGYSKRYLDTHQADIILHRAAKHAFNEAGLKKLPSVKSLQAEYAALLAEKKEAYAELHTVRDEQRELVTHLANVRQILGDDARDMAKERGEETLS